MINLGPTMPADVPQTVQTLTDLVTLIADPTATKKRLAELQVAIGSLQNATDEQKKQSAAFSLAQADHQRALDEATAVQSEKVAKERSDFDTACAHRKSELDDRDHQLSRLEAKAKADADAAEAIRTDLERRLSLFKQAAG